MITQKMYSVLSELIPMIVLFTALMIFIRLITAFYAKEKIIVYKELKSLCYIIYCFTLFSLVTSADFESYSNNFIPFKEILRYNTTSILFYRNVLGNIALFIPFGYLITDMIVDKAKKCNIFMTSIIILFTSLIIEIIQMFIGRSFDVDDILLNFIGGLIGFLVYKILHLILKFIPKKYITNLSKLITFLIIIVLFLLMVIIFLEVI